MTTITIERALLEQAYAMLSSNKTLIRVVMSRDELCVAIRSAIAAPAAAPWLHMKSAPKDGTAVLVLLDGSDIPHAARWISGPEDSHAPSDTSSAGWYLTWDGYRLTERDGPRCWMQCPSESDPQAPATAPEQPSWHDAPTAPGVWFCDEGDICYTWTAHNIEILDQFDPGDGLRWFGPILEDNQ